MRVTNLLRAPGVAALGIGLFFAGCATSSSPNGLPRVLFEKTAGVAVISAFHKLCGGARVDEYEQAWVDQVRKTQPLNEAQEQEVRGWLDRADKMVEADFDEAKTTKQCTDYPPDQGKIDRAIAGDFKGMI